MREQGETAACCGRLLPIAGPLASRTLAALRTRLLRGRWPISAPPRPIPLAPLSVPRV